MPPFLSLLPPAPAGTPRLNLRASSSSGFSITELLVVMCIIAVLATASGPMISSITAHNRFAASSLTLNGLLEAARQEAVTQNTFVWVALADAPSVGEAASAILVGSRTGDNPLSWETKSEAPLDLDSFPQLERIGNAYKLQDIRLLGPGEVSFEGLPKTDASAFEPVSWSAKLGEGSVTYTKAIRFTPTGEATVRSVARVIEIGLLPALGQEGNATVLRIAGLTGKTTILRPQ